MKATDVARTDTLSIAPQAEARIAESAEAEPGVILDHDAAEDPVSLEVLNACKRVSAADRPDLETRV